MVEEFDKKCDRKTEEGKSELKDSKDAKDQKELKEQKEREKQLR
jgi:hypothetical protein